jgi:nicotinate phosphoribosyltransferase
VQPDFSPVLLTDLYSLTMMQAYYDERMTGRAVFSLFVRRLPERRNYLMACGLADALAYLETARFDAAALGYLDSLGRFSEAFLQYLEQLRFTGDVHAVAEGTPVFANEPLVEVEAPIAEAQLFEAVVMNQIHLQTVLASKAARVVAAAEGRRVVDFGLRRMHGIDAGLKAARAFYIAGVDATSNVAARRTGFPSPARSRTAISRRTTTRARRSGRLPASIRKRSCSSTRTTRSRQCAR